MQNLRNSARKNWKSYGFALKGLRWMLGENNFRIQLVAAVVVVALGFKLQLRQTHWLVILLCIGGVLSAEIFNTAIEKLCDHLHPEQHPNIGKVKDMAAAGVLVIAMVAAVIGGLVFYQYLV